LLPLKYERSNNQKNVSLKSRPPYTIWYRHGIEFQRRQGNFNGKIGISSQFERGSKFCSLNASKDDICLQYDYGMIES
jgi:hypothetical protein